MANTINAVDVYALMNSIVSQATGRTDLVATDTTSFTAVGETVLRTGTENTLNALSTVIAKTVFSVRPYKGKLESLRVASQRWGAHTRKIITLYKEAEASTDANTDINPTQLADGQSIDMYKINKPTALQLNFYGTKKLQKHITRFRDQISIAFTNEQEFMQFFDAIMVEFANEIEMLNEAKSRATLLNMIAGISAMGLTEVDLLAEFNTEKGTTYTRAEILSSHLTEFMKYIAAEIKIYSERLTDMSTNYHASIDGYEKIQRHTPKANQKMIMYNPIFIKAESEVYSALFNPQYLEIGSFEGVNYWQSQNTPTSVNVKPTIMNTATGASADNPTAVSLPYVLGLLHDVEALGVVPQFDYSSSTPFNSAGEYWNMYVHWRFNSYCDYTENAILFVLGDGGVA